MRPYLKTPKWGAKDSAIQRQRKAGGRRGGGGREEDEGKMGRSRKKTRQKETETIRVAQVGRKTQRERHRDQLETGSEQHGWGGRPALGAERWLVKQRNQRPQSLPGPDICTHPNPRTTQPQTLLIPSQCWSYR